MSTQDSMVRRLVAGVVIGLLTAVLVIVMTGTV